MTVPVVQRQEASPRALVLLAACNGATYLKQQVDSILDQRDVQVSVLCSVDISTDTTLALLAAYARDDRRITVLPMVDRFGAAAPNFFRLLRDADLTEADVVAYSDQDDVWLPRKLARAWECMQANDCAAYSSNCVAFWPDGRTALLDKAQDQRAWDYFFEAAGPGCTYVLSVGLAKALQSRIRSCADLLNGIDYHDWLTYAFARHNQYAWYIDRQAFIHYRQHGANQLGANVGWGSFKRRMHVTLDGYGHDQALKIARAIGAEQHSLVRHGLARGRWGYFWLAMRARWCRRRARDQWLFFAVNIWMGIRNPTAR